MGDFYRAVAYLFPSTVTVYVGSVPKSPTFPYAVLWGDLGSEVSESLADIPDHVRINFRVTYVGLRWDQMAWVAAKVRPALNRAVPSVAGWLCGGLRQSSLMDMQTDYEVTLADGSNPVFSVDEFALVADKT
jgi:hypothetical protein